VQSWWAYTLFQIVARLVKALSVQTAYPGAGYAFLVLALASVVSSTSFAGTKTWGNTGTDFNTGASWTGGSLPKQTGDDGAFTGPAVTNPNLSASFDFQAINFSASNSSGYTLSSSNTSITLSLESISTGAASAINTANTSGTNTISAPVIFGSSSGTQTITTAGGGTLVISGTISSDGATLTKAGLGTLILSCPNTYTTATSISAGVLNIQNATALGTTANGTTVTSGAALQIQGGIAVGSEALTINGSGISSTGALRNISSNNSWAGNLTLGSASTITSDAGTLTISGGITNGGFGLTENGAGNVTISGAITGNGGLTMSGTGTLTVSGTNTYSGGSTINSGTVVVSSASSLGATAGGLTINAGTLEVATGFSSSLVYTLGNASSTVQVDPYQTLTLSSALGGTGTLNKTGSGTMVLSGANTYTGGTKINGGTLNLGSATALGPSGTVTFGGGTLQYSASNTSDYSSRFSTAASQAYNIDTNGQNVTFASALTSSGATLTKVGSGTLTLTGANTFNGSTTINGGTLKAAAASGSALGSTSDITVNSGGTLMLGANDQISNSASLTLAGGTLSKGNYSEGSAGAQGVGAMTLTASDSHIDFGTGTVGVLSFSSLTANNFTLTIDNWTGNYHQVGSGSTDRLIFDSDQTSNLGYFDFTGYGTGGYQIALAGGFYEVVAAVPEPSPALAMIPVGAFLLWKIGRRWRRRIRRCT